MRKKVGEKYPEGDPVWRELYDRVMAFDKDFKLWGEQLLN
jgi:hypothetical protein